MMKIKTLTAALMLGAGLGFATEATDTLSLQLFRNLTENTEGNMAYSPTGVEAVLRQLKSYSAGETLAELSALPMSNKAATFNINTGLYLAEETTREKFYGRMKLSEAKKLYIKSGHEVAVHALTHPFL